MTGVLQKTITAFLNWNNDFNCVEEFMSKQRPQEKFKGMHWRLQAIAALVSNRMDGSCSMSQK